MTADPADAPADLTNGDLARIFHEIGDILELKGELVFKTVAYHRAADAIGSSPIAVMPAYRSGTPPQIPGVGKAISDKLQELATTGHMAYYDRLRAEIPSSLVELLRIPGLGPKTVRQFNTDLGIETVDDLREAAESGRLRGLRGMSTKTEVLVLAGIAKLDERFDRMRLDSAEETITSLIDALSATPGRPIDGAGRLVPAPEGVDRRSRHPRRDRPAEGADRGVHLVRTRRFGRQQGRLQGRRPADARAAGRPDGDATGRGGDLPDPLHRLQGTQRPAPRDGARPRLEPVGEGLPEDRRGRRAADRRCRRAAHVRQRGRGVRVPRPAVHRPGAARGQRRDRGRPGRPPAGAHRPRRPARRPAHATPTGPTATSRSRSWPTTPGGAATPTRS